MYIKLIEPKTSKRPMDTELKIRMSPPLGLYTIANMLRREHTVVVQNENIEEITYDKPDLVGIMVMVNSLPRAIEIAKKFRAQGTKVVAGGIHVTTAYKTIPEEAFDALCIGAAEGVFSQIIADCQAGEMQARYFCNSYKGEEVISPAYDMIEKNKYLSRNIIHTSRGCPFKCDFCYNSGEYHHYVTRPVADVVADIRAMGWKHVMFLDDNLTGNLKWLREFLAAIKPMGITWNAACTINIVDHPDLLDEMRAAGCQSLFIGFESVTPASIQGVHKVQNHTEKYEFAVNELHKRGIMVNASFVFGLDEDTPETFSMTLDWVVRNKIETVTSHILTPYPGTVVYDQMKKDGRLLTDDMALYDTAHVVFQPKNLTEKELYDGYIQFYKDVYSFKNIWRRMPEQRSLVAPYLLFNFVYRKFGVVTNALCRMIGYERLGYIVEKMAHYT